MNILFEDEHMIIVSKPQNMPSQSDPSGDLDLCSELEAFLKARDNKNITLYVVHRLDRPVGGIIAYAKTKDAAGKLSELIKKREFNKTYLCVACGTAEAVDTELIHYLKKKSGQNVSIAVHKNNEGAKEARLTYTRLDMVQVKRDTFSLLSVNLHTGRHHQIRVQMSAANLPLWGDAKYHPGAKRKRNWTQIALWSHKLNFVHPFTGAQITLVDFPPSSEPWTHFDSHLES